MVARELSFVRSPEYPLGHGDQGLAGRIGMGLMRHPDSSFITLQNVDARLHGGELEAVYGLTQRIYLSGNLPTVWGT